MFWIYFCSSFIFLGSINGYSRFQMLIPNGDRVKHPCRNEIWNAVGHMQPNHIPQKNSFGLLWKSSERIWNRTICEADSDGDGLTNGAELGDANCNWRSIGDHLDPVLGHPGLCEPSRQKCNSKSTSLYSECTYPPQWSENVQVPDHRHPPPGANDHPQNSKRKALNRAQAMGNVRRDSRMDGSGFRRRMDAGTSRSITDNTDISWSMNSGGLSRSIDRSMRAGADRGMGGSIDRRFDGGPDRGMGGNRDRGFSRGPDSGMGGNIERGFSGGLDSGMRRDVNTGVNGGVDRNALRRTMIGKNVFGGTLPIGGDTSHSPMDSIIPDSPGPIDTNGPVSTGGPGPIDIGSVIRDRSDHDRGSVGIDRSFGPDLGGMQRFIDTPDMIGRSDRRTALGSAGSHVPTRITSGSGHGSRVSSMSTGYDSSHIPPNTQYHGRMPARSGSRSTFTGRTIGVSPESSSSFTTGSLDPSVIRNSVMGRIARMRNAGGRIPSGPISGGSSTAYTGPIRSHRMSSRRHRYPAHWRSHSSRSSSTSSTRGYPPRRFRHGHVYPPGYP